MRAWMMAAPGDLASLQVASSSFLMCSSIYPDFRTGVSGWRHLPVTKTWLPTGMPWQCERGTLL